jgi:hypothetical protein
MSVEVRLFIIARLAASFFLVWALRPHPFNYFESLRLGTMAVCAFGIYCALRWKQQGWAWAFGFLALLFNPFAKVALNRQTWNVLDVAVALVLVASIFLLKPQRVGT